MYDIGAHPTDTRNQRLLAGPSALAPEVATELPTGLLAWSLVRHAINSLHLTLWLAVQLDGPIRRGRPLSPAAPPRPPPRSRARRGSASCRLPAGRRRGSRTPGRGGPGGSRLPARPDLLR